MASLWVIHNNLITELPVNESFLADSNRGREQSQAELVVRHMKKNDPIGWWFVNGSKLASSPLSSMKHAVVVLIHVF